MASAFWTFPELIWRPVVVRSWVFEIHLVTTALAPDLNLNVMHGRILQWDASVGQQLDFSVLE